MPLYMFTQDDDELQRLRAEVAALTEERDKFRDIAANRGMALDVRQQKLEVAMAQNVALQADATRWRYFRDHPNALIKTWKEGGAFYPDDYDHDVDAALKGAKT